MKKTILSTFALSITVLSFAQMNSFPGYRAGNFTGVNGAFFNPSSIADSRYRWDVNLLSFNMGLANNKADFKLDDIFKNFDEEELKNKILAGDGSLDALVNADITGPSVMFNLSAKHSLALTTRVRAMGNIREMDATLINTIIDAGENASLPYTFSSNKNSRITVNGWTEFGLSYARVISNQGPHFFKGGLSLKYLAGVGNTYVQINGLNGTIKDDVVNGPYLDAGSRGTIGIGLGGINIGSLDEAAFKFNGSGIGADLGLTYEWRPNAEMYMNENGESRRDKSKYKVKVGIALLDLGKIKYKRDMTNSGTYSLNVKPGDKLDMTLFDDREMDELKDVLESPANNPRYFTSAPGNNEANYFVKLPASLAADVDLNLNKGFFINLGGQFALGSKSAVADAGTYSGVTLTPRYEGRAFGFYLPVNYNSISDFNAGVSLRLGPIFLGSGSILTALMDKSKQADVYFGLRFGITYKKKKDKKKEEEESASEGQK